MLMPYHQKNELTVRQPKEVNDMSSKLAGSATLLLSSQPDALSASTKQQYDSASA
jgi:hypothetical protein